MKQANQARDRTALKPCIHKLAPEPCARGSQIAGLVVDSEPGRKDREQGYEGGTPVSRTC